MSTYTIDEGALFEKSGDSYIIEGIRFTTAYGDLYCAAGRITPENCVNADGEFINEHDEDYELILPLDFPDITEELAKGHLQWMASDFERRGCGVGGKLVVDKLVAYTNMGPILIPLPENTEVTIDEGKSTVNVESVVSVVEEVVAKSEAAKAEALAAEVVVEEAVKG